MEILKEILETMNPKLRKALDDMAIVIQHLTEISVKFGENASDEYGEVVGAGLKHSAYVTNIFEYLYALNEVDENIVLTVLDKVKALFILTNHGEDWDSPEFKDKYDDLVDVLGKV